MKNLLLISTVIVILTSCSQNNEDNAKIKRSRLHGTWLFAKVNIMNAVTAQFDAIPHDSIGPNNRMLDFVQFDEKENVWLDTGGRYAFKGKYVIKDSIITLQFNGEIPNITFSSLEMVDTSRFRFAVNYQKTNDKLVYELYGSKSMKPSDSSWRTAMVANATDKEIATRLKEILSYYSSYCTHISRFKTTYFKPQRINLPFMLYSGGVGLFPIEKWDDDFSAIMNTPENKQRAFDLLQKAFNSSSYSYPTRENLLAEYADCFTAISKELQ